MILRRNNFRINRVSLTLVGMAICSWIISLIVNQLPVDLSTKIAVTLVFVSFSYALMLVQCVKIKGIANVLFIILCLSVMFYYGQHIVSIFDSRYLTTAQTFSILDGKLSDSCIINASFLIIACMLLVAAGFLSRNIPEISNDIITANTGKSIEQKLSVLRIVGLAFLMISIYPTIRYLLAQYALSQTYGYLGRRNLESATNYYQILGVSYLEISLSQFFLPALYALMLSTKSNLGKAMNYIIMVIYLVMYYMTGSRYNLLKMLVTVFLIHVIWIKPLNRKDIRKYIVIGAVMIILFSVGSVLRNSGSGKVDLSQVMDEMSPSGTLWESGITFTTVSNLIDKCPSQVPFFYGKSWIGSILQCLPNALRFGFFDKYSLQTSSTFSPLYYNSRVFGYGSSFIAEGFYNFGYLVYPIMLAFGYFLSWIDTKLKVAKKQATPYLFLILVYVCGELAYGVRNDLSSVLRVTLYTVGIIVVMSYVIYKLLYSRVQRASRIGGR